MKNDYLERPVLAVDVVLFTVVNHGLYFLTYKRKGDPFTGARALPGVAVRIDETLALAARRSLQEKGIKNADMFKHIRLEQLATFDAIYRDPRGRTVSAAYMGITKEAFDTEQDRSDDINDIKWMNASDAVKGMLPFDHDEIFAVALERLQGKLKYTNIARSFLPDTFRIEEIQGVYEAILKRRLNRNNFRNKLLKINMIEQVSILSKAVGKKGGRPPHLYRFYKEGIEAVDRDFI